MNILFFLTPKGSVSYVNDTDTIYKALDTIRHSGYTAIPIITKSGKYIGTITEGDFLWNFIDQRKEFSPLVAGNASVSKLKRRFPYRSVNVNANISDLLSLAYLQNFIPVVDDRGIFIGIVTRQDIMKHYCSDTKPAPALQA